MVSPLQFAAIRELFPQNDPVPQGRQRVLGGAIPRPLPLPIEPQVPQVAEGRRAQPPRDNEGEPAARIARIEPHDSPPRREATPPPLPRVNRAPAVPGVAGLRPVNLFDRLPPPQLADLGVNLEYRAQRPIAIPRNRDMQVNPPAPLHALVDDQGYESS
jgi:hypothetical protein